jgi:hypothetical protein
MSLPGAGPVRFTPEELDRLFEMVTPELDDDRTNRTTRDEELASSGGRQELFLHTVDRAIAEIAGPRGRRRRARR